MKLNGMTIKEAREIAKKYYSKDKYEHAVRVMSLLNYDMIPKEFHEACQILALMHDLLEDTDFTLSNKNASYDVISALNLLTHFKENETYVDYIKAINSSYNADYRKCAWWVKLADMKDHLMQKETLTDRLKEKYLEGLAYLL